MKCSFCGALLCASRRMRGHAHVQKGRSFEAKGTFCLDECLVVRSAKTRHLCGGSHFLGVGTKPETHQLVSHEVWTVMIDSQQTELKRRRPQFENAASF